MILKVLGLNNCWDQLYCYAIKATLNRFNQLCSEDDLAAVQCPARVDIESSRSESEKNSLSLFVREVKSEMKI